MRTNQFTVDKNETPLRAERCSSILKALREILYAYDAARDCMTVYLDGIDGRKGDLILPNYFGTEIWRQNIFEEDAEKYIAFFRGFRCAGEATKVNIRYGPSPMKQWYRISGVPVFDSAGTLSEVVGRIRNITDEKREYEALEWRARVDAMTNLLNKVTFETECEAAFAAADQETKYALLVIDINDLKVCNDNFGHLYGDRVIKTVAAAFSAALKNGEKVGRIGGDEFGVLLRCSEDSTVADEIAALRDYIKKQPFKAGFPVQVSVGTAFFPENGRTYKALFQRADREMYLAKRNVPVPPFL